MLGIANSSDVHSWDRRGAKLANKRGERTWMSLCNYKVGSNGHHHPGKPHSVIGETLEGCLTQR
jgi:hypothetical protein